jgi:hypothetical protein
MSRDEHQHAQQRDHDGQRDEEHDQDSLILIRRFGLTLPEIRIPFD